MRPLKDKIIIERIEAEKQTASGIILRSSEGPDYAKVISVGPDVKEVSVDDKVLVNWNLAVKSGDVYVILEENIIAVVEEE